jgi:hypothetical protein
VTAGGMEFSGPRGRGTIAMAAGTVTISFVS